MKIAEIAMLLSSGVPRGAVGHAPPWANFFFLHSPNCIAMSGKLVVRLFARATEMNGDRIAPPRVVGQRTAQFAQIYVPTANAHKYYRRAVFFHWHDPTT